MDHPSGFAIERFDRAARIAFSCRCGVATGRIDTLRAPP